MSQWLLKHFDLCSTNDTNMAQEQGQEQPHSAGRPTDGGDSMQNLVIRLLLAASQTAEPIASELKDIAMSLSCATMARPEDCSSVGVKDKSSSSRNSTAAPSFGMLTDGDYTTHMYSQEEG